MQNLKPTIFVSASIGWVVRNYFHTSIISKLQDTYDVIVLATEPIAEGLRSQGYDKKFKILTIEDRDEPTLWKLFRQVKKKIYMDGRNSHTEVIWKKYVKRPMYQNFGDYFFSILLKLFSAKTLFNITEKLENKLIKTNRMINLFLEYKPVYFFSTHITSYWDELLVHEAQVQDIPIIYMVMSWDHISSKVVLRSGFHTIFVWNQVSQREILETYPTYTKEQVKIVGIPQYDLFYQKPEIDYNIWCIQMGLSPKKRTILYASAPSVRHEQQHIILEEMLNEILVGSKLPNDLQVLLKCHPLDSMEKYLFLESKYPIKVIGGNLRGHQNAKQWMPEKDELVSLRNCLYFCSLNINIFSTVTLEAAFFDKPIVHIAFDVMPIKNRIPCHEYYNFEHFKPIVKTGATLLVNNYSELYQAVNSYLEAPETNKKEREKLVEQYWARHCYPSVDTIVNEMVVLKNTIVV